jgi:hypothetical protein
MSSKVKCTCGWSWNKSDSSKKDMYICHECGRDNSNNMKNGGWLDSITQAQNGINSPNVQAQEKYLQEKNKEGEDYEKSIGNIGEEIIDFGQRFVPRLKYLPGLGSSFAVGEAESYNQKPSISDELGMLPNPYAQIASFVLLEAEVAKENRDKFAKNKYKGKDLTKLIPEEEFNNKVIDNTYIPKPKIGKLKEPKKENKVQSTPYKEKKEVNKVEIDNTRTNKPRVDTNYKPEIEYKFTTPNISYLDNSFNMPRELNDIKKDNTYVAKTKYKGSLKNGGWLDNYGEEENANESSVSLPDGYVGMGNDTQGRNSSPAWGGQFQTGGSIPGAVGFSYARTGSIPSNGKYAKKTMASAQKGLDWQPKMISQNGNQVKYGTPEYEEAYNKGEVLSSTGERSPIALDEVTVQNTYKKDKNWLEQYADKITEENKDAGVMGAIFGTPLSAITSLPQMFATKAITGEMQRPSEAMDIQNPYGAFAVDAVLDPANLVGAGMYGKAEGLANLSKTSLRNFVGGQMMERQVAKGALAAESIPQRLGKIDLINQGSVNVKNDLLQHLGEDGYNNFLKQSYAQSKQAFDNPLIEFKGNAEPNSFIEGLGSNRGPQSFFNKHLNDTSQKEGLLFKEKFCEPGSECAKSANAVSNRMFTDITGQPFNAEGNAQNAWHMEEQMLRNNAEPVPLGDYKLGDRVLMGNGIDQSTYVPGFTADREVRHAGTYAGIKEFEGKYIPMILESGKNNAMYLNPTSHTFTGANSIKKALRPEQFVDNTFGENLVDKNIRYAYRDKPSVAKYSSNQPAAQKILDNAETHRETIKRTHDITNDEFDELLNSLVGIGSQETKLNGALPGSKLSKAKIQLQNQLTKAGLTKPIKQTMNLVKKGLNTASPKSELPKYPGTSVIEMESAKLSKSQNISFKDALKKIKDSYQPQDKYIPFTVEPSKGMFRQKYQTVADRQTGFGNKLSGKNSLENALGQMSENYTKMKAEYPNADPRKLIDLTTLMWNSPGKAKNKELVDFFLFGKENPDVSKFKFDYVDKINKAKDNLINVHPQGKQEPYLQQFRKNNYPEIQYEDGGVIKDDRGYWNPKNKGKIVQIDQSRPDSFIDMRGVYEPLLGVSDKGEQRMMYPGEQHQFEEGTKYVREYPKGKKPKMAKNGMRQEQKSLQNLDNLTNFTNYNTKQPGGWLDQFN